MIHHAKLMIFRETNAIFLIFFLEIFLWFLKKDTRTAFFTSDSITKKTHPHVQLLCVRERGDEPFRVFGTIEDMLRSISVFRKLPIYEFFHTSCFCVGNRIDLSEIALFWAK